MEKVHDSIAWYQKQIGSYDKQLWEQSVENKLLKAPVNVHHAPRKTVRLKTEFIDVDLIRGSTFSKSKPQAPWTYITRKALVRVFLLPFCYSWWIQQTSVCFFAILFFLYCLQLITLFIYSGNVGETIIQDELALSEVFFPIIITFILGLIHSQTVLSHYSHKPPHRDHKKHRNLSKSRKRDKDSTTVPNRESTQSPTRNTEHVDSPHTSSESMATVSISDRRDQSTRGDDFSNTCLPSQGAEATDSDLLLRGQNSPCNLSLRGEYSGCDVNTQVKDKGASGNSNTKTVIRKSDLEKSFSDNENSAFSVLERKLVNKDTMVLSFEQGQKKLHQSLINSAKPQSSSDESYDKFEIIAKDADAELSDISPQTDKAGDFGSKSKEEDHFADTERCSDDTNCTQSDLDAEETEDNDTNEITEADFLLDQALSNNLTSSLTNMCSDEDGNRRLNIRRRHPSAGSKVRRRFASLQTEDLGEVTDSECLDDDDTEHSGVNLRRKRRLSATRSADLGEVARARHIPPKLTFLSEQGLNQHESSSENDRNRTGTGVSSEEWEDRIQSDVTTSSSYSSSCESTNGPTEHDEDDGQQDLNDLHQSWTTSSLNSINLLQPPTTSNIGISSMAPPDKVSCVIWEGNECKKVDLTALDIGWAIIDKVDNLPESSDSIMIGICFSILIGCVPIVFRAYHAKEIPSMLSYRFLLRMLELMVNPSWRRNLVMLNGIVQRSCLSLIFFFLLSVADRTFKQRLLYAKHFCYLTSSRRARKFDMPHFRLSKVRNIKTWLSLRSYLKRRGPQRSVDVIVSATFLTTISLVSLMCLQMLKDTDTYLDFLCNWELIVWCLCLGVYLLRFMTLGLKINKKYRNLSVLITEQINLYLQMEQKPHKKEELILANNVLKLAEDLLKELESPFKISGFSANPFIYNMTKVVVLSAFSTVLTELLGFKLKLYKIKFKA